MVRKVITTGVIAFPFIQGRSIHLNKGQDASTRFVRLKFQSAKQRWFVDVESEAQAVSKRKERGVVCFLDPHTDPQAINLVLVHSLSKTGNCCFGRGLVLPDDVLQSVFTSGTLPLDIQDKYTEKSAVRIKWC